MRKWGREFVAFLGRLWMGRNEARWGAGILYCERQLGMGENDVFVKWRQEMHSARRLGWARPGISHHNARDQIRKRREYWLEKRYQG